MAKVRFCDIKETQIAIHFTNQIQLEKLVDYLKAYGYDYGTGNQEIPLNYMDNIKELGVRYFSRTDNQYLTLDRSKSYHPRNYVSCGLGRYATKYNFSDIDWNVA